MKLYKISQSDNNNYDTYDSAIVVAGSEEEAKEMHPGGQEEWNYHYKTWSNSPATVVVEYIGEAKEGLTGIICSSFNAG